MMTINLGIDRGATIATWVKWSVRYTTFEYSEGEADLTQGFCVDCDSLKTGYGRIAPAKSPEWIWDKVPMIPDANPGVDAEDKKTWKSALSIDIFTKKEGYLVWTTNGAGAKQGIDRILNACWADKDKNPGKVACFKFTGETEDIKYKIGETKIPLCDFVGWQDRPENFVAPDPDVDIPNQPIIEAKQSEEEIPF